jgi:hypothetical protein
VATNEKKARTTNHAKRPIAYEEFMQLLIGWHVLQLTVLGDQYEMPRPIFPLSY